MTIYFCPKCKTKDHWANEVCPKDATTQVSKAGAGGLNSDPVIREAEKPLPEVAAPIRKAKEFIDKVKFDRVAYQREYMRRRRAKANSG